MARPPASVLPITAFVAVGSNIQPERHIAAALDRLRTRVRLLAVSTFYRTAPLPGPGSRASEPQPDFLNGVLKIETDLEPRTLKHDVLRRTEEELGRVRVADKYAPRTLDLDLLLYGGLVSDEEGLRLPPPDLRARNFIAVPLLELAPDLVLPDTGERLATLAVARDAAGMVAQPAFTASLRAALQGGS
jgi:2-amino-4-hydroxy-6-hydroxymethyldihydropteridine diphosphokinase